MKKIIATSVASLMLFAGVAAAGTDGATVRVGDRLGSSSATANHLEGTPVFVYVFYGAAIAAIIYLGISSEHHNHSVSP